MEYIIQTICLFLSLFVYLLSGSAIYSLVGEGYKATPLRCFSVGVAFWVLLVVISTVVFPISVSTVWWIYVSITVLLLFILPKKEQKETFSVPFFYQVLTSVGLLLPVFYFLRNDSLHFWQEFAVYAKGVYQIADANIITQELLSYPLAYQLAIVPVSFFTNINDSIFACFNFAVFAFVACEFVRNSGVRFSLNNVAFPLIVTFTCLFFLNPFAINELVLSADPFIFLAALALAFAEYIFRAGHLPKTVAALPAGAILCLMAFTSTQGLLLAISLLVTLSLRYLMQCKTLNRKQLVAYCIMPLSLIGFVVFWQYFLSYKGLDFFVFDFAKLNQQNITLVYNAMLILLKQHLIEVAYIAFILIFGLYSFKQFKTADDLIIDRFLIKSVFWITLVYLFVCLPLFFAQYDYVARASYSLGFSSIAVIQFIILMPLGRFIKENLDHLDLNIASVIKLTIVIALAVMLIMTRHQFNKNQNYKIKNINEISSFVEHNIPENSKVAIVDIHKTAKFYKFVAGYKNASNISYISLNSEEQFDGIKKFYNSLKQQEVGYVLLHAPNNLLIKSLEHNLDPKFTYLYELKEDGFYLVKKFENKLYKDTNILIK